MAVGQEIIPLLGINLDLHESLLPNNVGRFIKNLVYEIGDTASATGTRGAQAGVFKPLESNFEYLSNFTLPDGYCQTIGAYFFKETKEIFVFLYNEHNNHRIYRINGTDATYNIIKEGPCLNFTLRPEHFIHVGGCTLTVIYVTDPATGLKKRRSFLQWTEGFNPQGFIAVEDAIATNGFDPALFPYFKSPYDPCWLIRMGVPTPKDCIGIDEVDVTTSTIAENNRLLFNTWQFRLMDVDVWGRPSEHGIMSDMYLPGGGDCNPSSNNLPRCLDLSFDAPPPHIDKVQVEYRNCNSSQWYVGDTLELYNGSALGDWWLRSRNPDVTFDANTKKITYRFCADKLCDPIPVEETNRLGNPLPSLSESISKIGKFTALSNNTDGFIPFSKELRDKIKVTVEPPAAVGTANSDIRNITVLVAIHDPHSLHLNKNVPIFKVRFVNKYGWGFNLPFGDNQPAVEIYKQYFKNENQKGFVGYLAGTDAYAISRQYELDTSTREFTEVTDFGDSLREKVNNNDTGYERFYFQSFTFTNIPKGKYIFRIADHQSDPAVDPNYQKTSTYVGGQTPFDWNQTRPYDLGLTIPNFTPIKEIEIDVCDKNYDSREDDKILIIWDLMYVSGLPAPGGIFGDAFSRVYAKVAQGYVYNTNQTNIFKYGIEQLFVNPIATGREQPYHIRLDSRFTDHNGFYFISDTRPAYTYRIDGVCGGTIQKLAEESVGRTAKIWEKDFYMDANPHCDDYETQPCNHILLKGKVKLCGTSVGLPNIGVVLARGQVTKTDGNGDFTLIVHDDISKNGGRIDNLYYMTNSCGVVDCNSECLDFIPINIAKPVGCTDRLLTMADVFIKFFNTSKGLLSGGTYPAGVVGWDWLGRPTFVQPLKNIIIPSFQETKVFAPSLLRVDIDPTAIFPPETEYITFWIGAETDIESYVTTVVDDVQFIDNTGSVNEVSPTQIKIYYSSLIEYNKQNNYNTTVNWRFISADTNEPVISDKVTFLLNGNGEFFDKTITALVKYDKDGQYFLINYTDDLKNLVSNAIVRIHRPKVCTGIEGYFELCSTVDIKNRHATKNTFYLNAFDTYYIPRSIPVPVLQTPADPDADPPTPDIFVNELRIYGVPFEHDSPSDFWGKGCHNIGRVNVKNPYETVLYHRDQIALSGAMSPNGVLNFLNYFDEAKKTSFDEADLNGIVSVLFKTGIVMVIGQSNELIVGFSDNLVRINQDGTAQAGSIKNAFGQPSRKATRNFGCQLFDKNTIKQKDGLVEWLDTNSACLVQHNYQQAISVSDNIVQGYLRNKIKYVQQYNLTHVYKKYFVGGINPVNSEYLLTDFLIRGTEFENTLREWDITKPETIAFDTIKKAWKGSYIFCPEYYSELEGERDSQAFFTFRKGIPFSHYTTNANKTYGKIYGVNAERVFEVVASIDGFVKKKPLSIAVLCKESMYFADRVITETGQETRMLKAYWDQADYGFYAPFLCDTLTLADPNLPIQTGANKLLDGDTLTGTWIKIRLIGDPDKDNVYSQMQGCLVSFFAQQNESIKK